MIRLIITSAIILGCAFGAAACDDLSHEVLKDDGKLSWAFAFNGCKRTFYAIGALSATTLFL